MNLKKWKFLLIITSWWSNQILHNSTEIWWFSYLGGKVVGVVGWRSENKKGGRRFCRVWAKWREGEGRRGTKAMERKRGGGGGGGEREDRGKGCHVELKVDNHKIQHLSLLFFFFFFFPSLSVSLSCSCSHKGICGCYNCKLVYALARETHGGYVFQDWSKGSTMDLASLW